MMKNLRTEQEQMVQRQLAARGIRDQRVLDAFRTVPREEFVPGPLRPQAYADNPLGIGNGQTISQPYMVALMTQVAGVNPTDTVLEIGTGSGYQTAILACLAQRVVTVERISTLSQAAREVLTGLQYTNIQYRVGDGTLGWPEDGPYDVILVTAGAPDIPPALQEQLAEGGRLVIPVGSRSLQTLVRVTRLSGQPIREDFGGCVFVPLLGQQGWSSDP